MSRLAMIFFLIVPLVTARSQSPPSFRYPAEPLRHGNLVSAIAISPDGRMLVSAGWDKMVRLWDLTTGKQLHQLAGHLAEIECVAFSPDGNMVASGSWDKTIRLWDVSSGKEIRTLGEHPDGILALAFSPDGKTLASGNQDRRGQSGTLHLWDVASGKGIIRFAGHSTPVTTIAFAPDGQTVASGGVDSRVCICEVATGKLLQEWRGHQGWVYAVAFSGDGQLLASAGADKMVRLWEVAPGKERRLFQGHQDKVRAVAFSPDGRTLASGGFDRTIRLWEVATGKERHVLATHTAGVRALAFVPARAIVASGSSDGTVRLHPLFEPGQPVEAKELESLWTSLASEDAAKAFLAVKLLVRSAEQSVPFLRQRLGEGRKPDEKRIGQLIAELDHDQFVVREQATQELAKLGDQAEAALRKALQGNISIEVRRRIDDLLEKLAKPADTPDRLRQGRALEVLENAGTPEARQVLQKLAEGPANSFLTREAQAALKRLGAARSGNFP